jgi:ABC-type branched-subunit amino acid transport system substrate-binding protein
MTRRNRLSAAAVTVTAAALVLTGCGGAVGQGAAPQGAGDTFKIGLIAPVTGPAVQEGLALQRGFELGIKKINESGGVLGQPVDFVMVDDQASAAKSTQLAQRLVTQDEVDYLFGTIPGDTTAAVGEISEASKVPFSSVVLGDAPYCGQYFFPFGEPDQTMLDAIVPKMMEKYGKRVAMVGNDYVFPRGYLAKARTMIEAAGGSVELEEYSPLGTADWQPVVNKLSAAKPDWVLSAVVGGDATSFVSQADQSGLLDKTGLTGVSIMQDFYPGLADRVEGMQLPGRYSDQLEGEANTVFVESYREAYDFTDPIPGVAANAYEGIQLVARAVEEAGSTDPDAIAEALSGTSVENGVFGSGHFTKDQRFVTDMYLLDIQADGKYVPVQSFDALENTGSGTQCGS